MTDITKITPRYVSKESGTGLHCIQVGVTKDKITHVQYVYSGKTMIINWGTQEITYEDYKL